MFLYKKHDKVIRMFKKLKYLIKCIFYMDYKNLFKTVGTVHKICGKNRIGLFFDIVHCGLRYGAGYKDYLLCEWYLLNKKQRETYVTRGINNAIARAKNHPDFYYIFLNKDKLYPKFSKFLKRDWLFMPNSTKEDFMKFMENKTQLIVKPSNESCGIGVEKLYVKDYKSLDELYDYINPLPSRIVEEVIEQHDEINKINPKSVNTLRIVTVYSEGVGNLIYAFIRIGNGERAVDNINAGGMCAPIDLKTGIISHVAYDKDRITYENHPNTGYPIKGVKIPMWEECIDFVKECAQIVPEMGYVGWDVAVTPTGPVLVEGNELPGHDILQMPPHVPDRIGMLPEFKKYIKNL